MRIEQGNTQDSSLTAVANYRLLSLVVHHA